MKKKYTLGRVIFCSAAAASAAVLLSFAVVCFLAGGSEGAALFSKLNSVRRVIETAYVGQTDWNAVADGAAEGMVRALDDRWSYYMTQAEYENYKLLSANTTNGIGVTVSKEETSGGFAVVSVTEDSPAGRAGVQAGQLIVSVAGQEVGTLDTKELRALIQAQEGTFSLGLRNPDGSEVSVSVGVETVYNSPVRCELLEGGVGYIRINNFEEGAAERAQEAIRTLAEDGAASLLFDVRSNPGGRLDELIELLDALLPEGELFVSVGKDGDEKVYTSDSRCIEMPMAVLINGSSYSAAEFFAAALMEYDWAEVIGEASTGKGRSQVTYLLSDGSAVHISSRRYLTPNRVDLSEAGGLVPDIEVGLEGENDTQLQEAIKYLS